jgi:hypothetical protein
MMTPDYPTGYVKPNPAAGSISAADAAEKKKGDAL